MTHSVVSLMLCINKAVWNKKSAFSMNKKNGFVEIGKFGALQLSKQKDNKRSVILIDELRGPA